MSEERQYAAIVDAYSSGNLLAPEFKSRGLECIHIQSTPTPPSSIKSSFHAGDFKDNLIYTGEKRKILEDCRRYSLRCLVAGSETGVELADMLSEALGLPSNRTGLSASRRDKFEMVAQVKRNGLRTIPSFKTDDCEDALKWIGENTGWPVVIKPLRSAGSDSVFICASAEEFQHNFNNTIGKYDQFRSVIKELLIQQKIDGPEYIVDTVSCNGKHHTTNVWSITKGTHNGGNFVIEYNELLRYEEAQKKNFLDYTFQVINALGIKYGPAHTELFLSKEGPVLIETAARLHGAGFANYSQRCVGYSQVDLTVDAYVDEHAFHSKAKSHYHLQGNLIIVELISGVEGELKDLPLKDEIEALPSFYRMKMEVQPGNIIQKTSDDFSSPGHVVLMHSDLDTIWRDYDRIRYFEKNGLYEI